MSWKRSLLLGCCLCWLLACEWQPIARDVQPERLLEGDYTIQQVIDETTDRHVLATRNDADGEHYVIVDLQRRKSCDLPSNTYSVNLGLSPPVGVPAGSPPFKLAILRTESDGKHQLYLSDPDCKIEGPYGEVGPDRSDAPLTLLLEVEKRGVIVWKTEDNTLMSLDPWSFDKKTLAKNVEAYTHAPQPATKGTPPAQKLWLLEDGKLVLRTVYGDHVHTVASNVADYQATVLDQMRIAYEVVVADDAAPEGKRKRLYEAVGPDFVPYLVAEDGCAPLYAGTTLALFSPCRDEQLYRINLLDGMVETFAPGVRKSFIDRNALIELAREATGKLDEDGNEIKVDVMYATMPGRARTRVEPYLKYYRRVINGENIVGATADLTFGVWNAKTGKFTPLYEGVMELLPFNDLRTSSYLWLMMHEAKDGLATLSVVDEQTYQVETLARGVPFRGYSVEGIETLGEPIIVTLEDTKVVEGAPSAELRARLLSGELGSKIDSRVTSYTMIALPLPGLLYTINEEARRGLWFAAL